MVVVLVLESLQVLLVLVLVVVLILQSALKCQYLVLRVANNAVHCTTGLLPAVVLITSLIIASLINASTVLVPEPEALRCDRHTLSLGFQGVDGCVGDGEALAGKRRLYCQKSQLRL